MSTPPPTIHAEGRTPDPDELTDLVERLGRGELIALPTETVYGIAARADDAAALTRLRELKGRPAGVPLSWHLAASEAPGILDGLAAHGLGLPGLVQRLASRYWPGPLTLVVAIDLPDDHPAAGLVRDGLLGLRAPAHPFTEAVLAACPFPLVMSSTNLHGEPPATDAAAALAALGERAADLDAVVDAGPTASAAAALPSTVLELAPGRFEVHREGLLSSADLRGAAGLAIGFACTGNTCRSPMAEGLAPGALAAALAGGEPPRTEAERAALIGDFGFRVVSMGLAAYPGSPASSNAVKAMDRRGVDLTSHASRPADLDLLGSLDLVLTMTRSHRDALAAGLVSSGVPGAAELVERVSLLSTDGEDVADPYGGDEQRYEIAARQIEAAVLERARDWV